MKNRISQWVSHSALAAAAMLAVVACTDDHFDVKNSIGSDQTLWQAIQGNTELSDFAGILKRTKVLQNENDRKSTLIAADLLDQPQSFTMWAPVNGTFNAKVWNDTLDAAARYAAQGTAEGRNRAQEIEYYVWSQFVANHIARFNHEGYTGNQQIKLLNQKNAAYTGAKFNTVPVTGNTIVANNGSLHLLQGASPFAYNIYDYIGHSPLFSDINEVLGDKSVNHVDTLYDNSTPGALNEKGDMVYIDTMFRRKNDILDAAFAQVRNEDSTYVAFIPTNAAWAEANEKVKKIFKYGSRYSYEWNGTDFNKKRIGDQFNLERPMHSNANLTLADSLQQRNTRQSITTNMFFAPYRMRNIDAQDSAALNHYVTHADSLISTAGTVFYNTAAASSASNANMNPALAGIKPYHASNGYIYSLPKYDFDPAYAWVSREKRLLSSTQNYIVLTTSNATASKGTRIELKEDNYNSYREALDNDGNVILGQDGKPLMVGVQGNIERDSYVRFQISNETSPMTVSLRLPQLYSTRYEVELVMVPSKTDLDFSDVDDERVSFTARVLDDQNNELEFMDNAGAKQKSITIDQDKTGVDGQPEFDQSKVNHIKLGKYVEIPKCYAELPRNIDSFPRLVLTLPQRKRGEQKIRCRALNIVAIVLKPYRGE